MSELQWFARVAAETELEKLLELEVVFLAHAGLLTHHIVRLLVKRGGRGQMDPEAGLGFLRSSICGGQWWGKVIWLPSACLAARLPG